ncbi:MAG TPA: DUF1499 domain-containing protein [Thermoanaerobaculia bacterium]|nr:DUF1499 domain-containing protein [Thermoanaerobaculia bacterium]
MPTSRLAPCPRTPNCVSTQAPPGPQHMDPIPYTGTRAEAQERLLRVLRAHPRTRIVKQEPGYLHAECRSLIFRFVDDVELEIDEAARLIHFRSASRLGRKDFGVNRARMEQIRAAFLAQTPRS